MLYVFGNIFRRVVGFAYINDERDMVKVSHLTFWGQRQDEIIDLMDLFPLADTTERLDNAYTTLERISNVKDYYYLSLRFGQIPDKKLFEETFGINLK